MAGFASHARQPCAIARDQPDSLNFGEFRQVACTLVVTSSVEENLLDTCWILPQTAHDRVEPEYKAAVGHSRLFGVI